jgi:antirestriction protein
MITTMQPAISNSDDLIDVRDVIERVEHLEQLRQPGPVDLDEDNETDQDTLFAELATLESLLADLKGYGGDHEWRGDWYPITLISDSYFVEAMRDLCEDIGDLPKGLPSYLVIDWDATARNLRIDYSETEFDGITYLYR